MLPSCVPSTKYDESLTNLTSEHLKLFYSLPRVLDLSEVMSYSKILNKDKELLKKANDAKEANKIVNGPAPLLTVKILVNIFPLVFKVIMNVLLLKKQKKEFKKVNI